MDDFIFFIRSEKAAIPVMESVSHFIIRKLKLKVNLEKSKLTHPWWMSFHGFSYTSMRGDTRIHIHSKSIKRLKERVKGLTNRNCGPVNSSDYI